MKGAARAPAHITSFFLVPQKQPWDTPIRCGSVGAGICLEKGVRARVTLSDDPYMNISHDDRQVSDPVTEATLKAFLPQGWGGDVELELDLPLGAGLGMSGACALATAVATLCALGEWDIAPESGEAFPAKAVGNAHIAEVLNRTGLGDVAAQAACFGAGQPLEVRRYPGVADLSHNVDTFLSAKTEVALCLTGEQVSTKETLEDEGRMELVRRAGARAKRGLPGEPAINDLIRLGRRFAGDAKLIPGKLAPALDAALDLEDTEASICMLGTTLYGIGDLEGLKEAWARYGEVVFCGLL